MRRCYCVPIDSYVEGEGYQPSIVEEGEAGHSPTNYFWGHDFDKACEMATLLNKGMGVSEQDAIEIVSSSMFGGGNDG